MAAQIIPHIVYQHAEEAAFLWILRDAAVRAPHYNLMDLQPEGPITWRTYNLKDL